MRGQVEYAGNNCVMIREQFINGASVDSSGSTSAVWKLRAIRARQVFLS